MTESKGISDANHSLLENVRNARMAKKEAKMRELPLDGGRGDKLGLLIKKLREEIVPLLEEQKKEWLAQRKEEFRTYLESISEKNQKKEFLSGLDTFLTLNYRLAKLQGNRLSHDQSALEDLVLAYTTEFFLSLRLSKRDAVPPKEALAIAKQSYRINPDTLLHLRKEFPEFEESLLRYVLIGSKNPEKRLGEIRSMLQDISNEAEFKWAPPWVLKTAIARHGNPRAFLKKAKGMAEQIIRIQPSIPHRHILDAVVLHARDPIHYLSDELGYDVA